METTAPPARGWLPNPFAALINDENYMWWATAPVILGMFIVILDSSIVNVALPKMMADFGSNVEEIEWVSTGYMLASAIMMPTTGFLGDRFGRKKLYAVAIFAFTIASMLCGAAWDTTSLVGFRILQGLVGGGIQPVATAILYESYPPEKRGLSMGIMGVGVIFAPMIGPTLGGYLVDYLSWRWVFYVNLPVGLIATFLTLTVLRESKTRHIPVDAAGFTLMALFLSTCLLATSQGNTKGWTSDWILGLFATSAVACGAFLVVELWRREPLIHLDLFKYRAYTAGTLASIVMGIGLFGGTFLVPLFLQNLMGYEAITTGLIMMPQAIPIVMLMPLSGVILKHFDARVPTMAGLGLLGISLMLQSKMTIETSTAQVVFWTVLRGTGMGLAFPAMNQTSLGAVPIQRIGQASGLFNVTRQLGGSFGIAMLSTLLTWRTDYHLSVLGEDAARSGMASPFLAGLKNMFFIHGSDAITATQQAGAVLAMNIHRQASVLAFQDAFWAAGLVTLIGSFPVLFMVKPKVVAAAAAPMSKEDEEALAAAHAMME